MPDSVGLRWDLEARDAASRAFNIAATSAARLADEANRAQRQLDELGRRSPNVRIQTNAPTITAQLAALRAEIDRLNMSRDRLLRDTAGAPGGAAGAAGGGGLMPWLLGAAGVLSPAAIPVAAVGAAGAGTLLLGINAAKKALTELTPEYHALQAVAGKSLTPGLNSLVNAATKLEGPVSGLIRVFGSAISGEVTKFSNMLANGGMQQFISYAKENLPTVISLFNNLIGVIGRLVVDLAPLGSALLKDLNQVASMANSTTNILSNAGTPFQRLFGGANGSAQNNGLPISGILSGSLGRTAGTTLLNRLSNATNPLPALSGHGSIAPSGYAAAAAGLARVAAGPQYAPSGALLAQLRQEDAAIRTLTADYSKLRDAQLNENNAQDTFHVQANQLKTSVSGLGHSLNDNTLHGSQLRQVLDGLVTSAQNGAKASKDYGYVLLHNIDFLKKKADAAGYGKQLDAILRSMHLMPAQIKSTINVQTWAARYNIQQLQSAIDQLPTFKTITINTAYTTSGGSPLAPRGSTYNSQVPRHHAMGGWIGPNEFGQVGELGYENYLSDSMGRVRIFSNAQSRRMSRSGGRSARRQTVRLVVDGQEFRAYLDSVVSEGIDRYDAGF